MPKDKEITLEDNLREGVKGFMELYDVKVGQIAKDTGLTPQTIYRWLKSETTMTLSKYSKIHKYMQQTTGE